MSSPSELQFSSADFLTKWMPSSTRAGVILSPPPELAGSLRNTAAAVPAPLHPDDSFVSDFAPLPASTDSSCLGVDGCGEGTRPVSYLRPAPQGISDGHFENLGETTSKTQDLPLMMKLEELKKWQQHMHEQLKAHQLEELLCLQEQQHRLLGVGDVPRICTEGAIENPGLPGAQWRKDTVQRSPDRNCGLPQELQLSDQQEHEDDEGMWDSDKENPKQSLELDDAFMQPDANSRQQEKDLHDKPIKPGIGGQKKTFEELLEEQLRLEEERLKSAQQQPKPARPEAAFPAKRPFLKRGQGLSRFTSSSKASAQKAKDKKEQKPQAITRSNAAPGPILKGGSCAGQALPVQRKTAVLNKENRGRGVRSPPQDIRAESRAARTTTVLGSHQRQNTGPAASQTAPEPRPVKHLLGPEKDYNTGVPVQVVRNTGPNLQPNPVIKQVGLSGDAGKEKSCVSKAQSAGAGGGLPWDSFELSFQEKLQRWECNRHLESVELGEFELLEQAAEELSFSSNSSFVMKVLCLDQQKRHSAIGLHQRRLSSTPIKSASGSEPQKGGGVRLADGSERERISLESVASGGNMRGNALKNEVTEGGREPEAPRNDEISEFGGKEVTVCFSAPPNPAYDKRSYQDEESFRDEVEEDEDEESDSVASNADGSTLTEDGHDGQRKVIFDDDDTWNDLDDTAVTAESDSRGISPVPKPTAGRVSPQEKAMLRKVAVSRAVEPDEGPETEPAPASQLMTRLFPSLKPKAQSAPPPAPPAPSENRKQDDTAQQVQSRQLRERLAELEMEIERFKKENTALTKLRQENERRQEDLRKELLMFEQAKAEELANFEEYKREENRKLQKERKLFEKHVSAARAIPDKKEREEIQLLKQQLSSQQEELKRRESRWASTHGRLRQQIDSLHQENAALRDEIRTLEKLRLSAWRKSSASAEKGVQTKDGPRVSDSSVAKGVTFATPLDSRGSGSSPPLSSAGRKSKDNSQAATGMKSSLRRSAGSGSSLSSSTTFSGRRTEEKPRPTSRSQEKPPNQKLEHPHHCSPRIDLEPEQPESCEARDPEPPQEVITHPDGKVEKVLAGGDRVIVFPNGTRKEVSADGLSAKVTFFNGDTKQITADQRVIYHYAEAQTTHITYPDGMEVLHFPNNQTEKHFPDGRKEITFPDQTVKNLFPDGREESVLTDGTIIQVNPDGTKEIHFNTGQKETHTAEYKRREYPDGTVKTVYTDGRQETRYPTGRLRVKDKDGNVVLDNRV
ncbi:centromere protein J isoform X2 [Gambusia affinis]|uniref:centromere protein J isoform X2 n=1 Tax=Gambusia affinis TaxID=33528 RepID=UPI001CDB6279|nr:centromere protein J isoform X2 [Gambusia affinis]